MLNNINKYYKKIEKDINQKFNYKKIYDFQFSKDKDDNAIIIISENDKTILKAYYRVLGLYNLYNNMWHWSYSIDLIDRKLTKDVDKIKDISDYVKNNYKEFDSKVADELYFRTSRDYFYTSPKNIINLVKLGLYVTKSLWYIPLCYGKDATTCVHDNIKKSDKYKRVEYIILDKIIQLR